ncbi:hypothetical protein HWV62_19001 [Athelia sp. TMB]|nr:hypothetical protein HWV62_19001 [Athelia sp. TMB]
MWKSNLLCLVALAGAVVSAPYTPSGGAGVAADPPPVYAPASDFDFQSLNLALNQEWIELDLFHYGLAKFSAADFEAAGVTPAYQFLIEFMADQEVGHATLLSNILQGKGAKRCTYTYPFKTVPEFLDFCQKLTRFGESGVYGFLSHLNSRPSAALLTQSIATEARQQMTFRQLEGLFPMPVWFEIGITQSMAWTLLAPYLKSCPAENPHIEWQNFPALNITNNPDGARFEKEGLKKAAVSNNVTALSHEGLEVKFKWEKPGKKVSYDDKYTTSTSAGKAKYAAWISQLNTTYTLLSDISGESATTLQPGGNIFYNHTAKGGNSSVSAPLINGTMFVLITDDNPHVTPFNLSLLNKHVVAGPAIYQAG